MPPPHLPPTSTLFIFQEIKIDLLFFSQKFFEVQSKAFGTMDGQRPTIRGLWVQILAVSVLTCSYYKLVYVIETIKTNIESQT